MWEAGTAGITEEPGGFRAFFDSDVSLESVTSRLGAAVVGVRQEEPTDWAQVSRDSFPAVLVGERFFLAPPWCVDATPAGRIRLVINPGMACGTGYHPCTQMCLAALDLFLNPGNAVLDVGTGSGILSEAVALLGARAVVGCDIDEESAQIARQRVQTPVFVGSIDAVRSASMNLIVANISATAVEDLLNEFQRVRTVDSILILSGFQAAAPPALDLNHQTIEQDGWACWIVTTSGKPEC